MRSVNLSFKEGTAKLASSMVYHSTTIEVRRKMAPVPGSRLDLIIDPLYEAVIALQFGA